MDPLPLAVILLEGEELAKLNLQIDWNLPKETDNYYRAFMGPSDYRANRENYAKVSRQAQYLYRKGIKKNLLLFFSSTLFLIYVHQKIAQENITNTSMILKMFKNLRNMQMNINL